MTSVRQNRLRVFQKLFSSLAEGFAVVDSSPWLAELKTQKPSVVDVEKHLKKMQEWSVKFVQAVDDELNRAFLGFAGRLKSLNDSLSSGTSVFSSIIDSYKDLVCGGLCDDVIPFFVRHAVLGIERDITRKTGNFCPLTGASFLHNGLLKDSLRVLNNKWYLEEGLLAWYRQVDFPITSDPLGFLMDDSQLRNAPFQRPAPALPAVMDSYERDQKRQRNQPKK